MANSMIELIGRKLQEARKKSGLTQLQVAKLVGINKVQLSYYETATREINLNILEKLANLYGFKIDYFISGNEIKEPEIQIAFRGEILCNEDLETITWGKIFLNNLCEMNDLSRE
ncbi:MAG: helix-turn-helix transcriptional regulator [Candidatus Atribacteria bacterium]|nr:helix-turn-helix transcriptional regulator [Candidatus Atribacteria bacterium]